MSDARTCELTIGGMDCADCARELERALAETPGVRRADVVFATAKAVVEYDPAATDEPALGRKITGLGYQLEQHGAKAHSTFRIEGMDCGEEVAILDKRLKRMRGVEAIEADLVGQKLRVAYDASLVSSTHIMGAVAETGMRAWLEEENAVKPAGPSRRRRYLTVASGCLTAGGLLAEYLSAPRPVSILLFVAAAVSGGLYTARRAWHAAKGLNLDINFLMAIAVVGAAAIGQWSEAASVVFLFALAQLLEAHSMDRARDAIRGLIELSPADATVRRGEVDRRVPIDDIRVGEAILVRPGEKIALDGRVVSGDSYVNQAPITGESIPVEKRHGDEVFAGTINGRGALEVEVTRLRRDTMLARIIHLVERAQAQRAPAQAFIDRFAHYYTPAVIAGAVVVAALPPLALGAPFAAWFYRALVLLVISCPCALVISTPVSIVSALAGAARTGVLIKGGVFLERAGKIRCVAFDKTGTLTRGTPEVTDIVPIDSIDRRRVLELAATLESHSEHPIAQAIVELARSEGIAPNGGLAFQSRTGMGAIGTLNGETYVIGNHRLIEEHGICSPMVESVLERLEGAGKTAVLLGTLRGTLGVIAVADQVREAAAEAVDLLREQGVTRIVMLTGDNRGTAAAITRQLGVDEFFAELLPEDKVRAVETLKADSGVTAMVGDGVNDAPALAAADIGIAMGTAASDAALETADVALVADELLKIPYALRLGRRTTRVIKTNIGLALALKAVFLVLAGAGLATLWMAVAADMGASLLVIFNGLRLLHVR